MSSPRKNSTSASDLRRVGKRTYDEHGAPMTTGRLAIMMWTTTLRMGLAALRGLPPQPPAPTLLVEPLPATLPERHCRRPRWVVIAALPLEAPLVPLITASLHDVVRRVPLSPLVVLVLDSGRRPRRQCARSERPSLARRAFNMCPPLPPH